MALDIALGESRGYWKYHVPDKKFKQAKAVGNINNERATLLFDSGAEVSIIDTAFARKVGCYIDESQTLECEGVVKSPHMAGGRARVKITLAGSLVYFFDVWVGPPTGGQDLILGMDFMVPAGIRLDLADGTICLPDEVRIQLAGRRPLYGDKVEQVNLTDYREIDVAGSTEVKLRARSTEHQKLWVIRGARWVPTVTGGPGKIRYLQLTNVSDRKLVLHQGTRLAMCLSGDRVPRLPGYVSVGSRRYAEWQNLAYQATTDTIRGVPEPADVQGPAVERPQYTTPTAILVRPAKRPEVATVRAECASPKNPDDSNPEGSRSDSTTSHAMPSSDEEPKNTNEFGADKTRHDFATSQGAERPSDDYDAEDRVCDTECLVDQGRDQPQPVRQGTSNQDRVVATDANQVSNQDRVVATDTNQASHQDYGGATGANQASNQDRRVETDENPATSCDTGAARKPTPTSDLEVDARPNQVESEDPEVCMTEGGDLYAGDVEGQMAVLPEFTATDEVVITDIQVGDPGENTPEEIDRLRKHLLMGKGNALPPAAKGAICDIDVGNANPVAQRCRKVAPQFREKLEQLIKGLLSAKMIKISTSPWASPIVVIVKKNGVDVRLCIDYRLVNSLTRLMVYPMPLINDLLEDLDKVLWYCSLDMASGFLVVMMTDRARAISAFITPWGLYEWNRIPFGLKNAPQIYQRLIDNALYGFLKITDNQDRQGQIDLFKDGEPNVEQKTSVLGRRSYIDDILVTASSWDTLCEKVEKLLDVCEEWNLSISVAKSFWELKKVDYLGHRVSAEGLEAHPKDLSALANLPFPTTLRSMQSFLGSLNYYSRFIEDFAIYASVLYELREADFYEIARKTKIEANADDVEGGESQTDSDKWGRAITAFTVLKDKIVKAPILQHFGPDREPVVIVYASKWAISAALMQEHDGVYKPVAFTSRTLKPNEINYGMVDKEVLALLRMLDVCYTQLVTRSIKVLTRYSTLAWLVHSSGLQGRLGRWAALLSSWTLEIVKCTKGDDEILGVLAASITTRRSRRHPDVDLPQEAAATSDHDAASHGRG